MTLIDRLWELDREVLFLTREQYEQGLEGWTIEPVHAADGTLIGAFIVKGPEFHFRKFTDAPATRAHLRRYPGALITQYGYALTRTPKDDERQLRFNQRLGFRVVGEDDLDFHLRIDKLPF